MGGIKNTFTKFFTNKTTVTILGVVLGLGVLVGFYIYRVNKEVNPTRVPVAKREILATEEDIATITKYAFMVNDFMLKFFKGHNIDLIDFKIEFGKTSDGTIILADEISPDTCRFWDSTTHEKLDKDRFRRDMGGVEDAYKEIMKRLLGE